MINILGLDEEDMKVVCAIIGEQKTCASSAIWLTALINMECTIYEDTIHNTDTTKSDALYIQRIAAEKVRKFISDIDTNEENAEKRLK